MKRLVIAALVVAAIGIGLTFLANYHRNASNPSGPVTDQAHDEVPPEPIQTASHVESFSSSPAPVGENPAATNWLLRLQAGEWPKLTAEQAEAYVAANKRSAESLLTAFRATKNAAYLQEALEKFPYDPKVNFVGYFDALLANAANYTPEQRRAFLERLATGAPANALADYLAAADRFKAGEPDAALAQLRKAPVKSMLQDYSLELMQGTEEAYRQAGYSEAEAKGLATWGLVLPHLSLLKQTGADLVELAGHYQQSGDAARAQEARELALHLADLLQDGSQQKTLINQLVGIAIERILLKTLDPGIAYDNSGQTIQNRIDELAQLRKSLNANVGPIQNVLPIMSPADQAAFFDRIRIHGEVATMQWAVGKYGN